jgi:DNA-binding CsgD family transcriptional regulator
VRSRRKIHPRGSEEIPSELISLGLTKREAEVLAWIARGKGNHEIGVILGTKRRTISKHVEHILSKLNVENRTAAAVWGAQAAGLLFAAACREPISDLILLTNAKEFCAVRKKCIRRGGRMLQAGSLRSPARCLYTAIGALIDGCGS